MHGCFFRIRWPQRWLIYLLFIFNTSLRTQIINLVIMFYYYLNGLYQAPIILAIFLFLNNKDLIQQYHIFIQRELILINVYDNNILHMMTRSQQKIPVQFKQSRINNLILEFTSFLWGALYTYISPYNIINAWHTTLDHLMM